MEFKRKFDDEKKMLAGYGVIFGIPDERGYLRVLGREFIQHDIDLRYDYVGSQYYFADYDEEGMRIPDRFLAAGEEFNTAVVKVTDYLQQIRRSMKMEK